MTGRTVELGARVTRMVTLWAGAGQGLAAATRAGSGAGGGPGCSWARLEEEERGHRPDRSTKLGGPGRSSLGASRRGGAAARARESAPPPRPRRLPGSWARGRGLRGSRAPGGVLRPPSPRAQTLPGAAPWAGGTWPALHLEVAGGGRCRSPSEAAGPRLQMAPKETEVGPSVREAAVRRGAGRESLGGSLGREGGGVSVPGGSSSRPRSHLPSGPPMTTSRRATGWPPEAETLALTCLACSPPPEPSRTKLPALWQSRRSLGLRPFEDGGQ